MVTRGPALLVVVALAATAAMPAVATAADAGGGCAPVIDVEVFETDVGPMRFRIERRPDGFHRGDARIEAALVHAFTGGLAGNLDGAPIAHLDAANVGVSAQWLRRQARFVMDETVGPGAAPARRAHLQAAFTDPVRMAAVLADYYDMDWTDDYPHVTVTVTCAGRPAIVATSNSQKEFMIPWKVERGGRRITTWDARIGRSLAALLPGGPLQQDRLAGAFLAVRLGQRLAESDPMCSELTAIAVDESIGPQLRGLRERFRIGQSTIATNVHEAIDLPVDRGWNAELSHGRWPTAR